MRHVLAHLPPVKVGSRRFWAGALGMARWLFNRRRGRATLRNLLERGVSSDFGEPLGFLLGAPPGSAALEIRRRIEDHRRELLRRGDEPIEAWVTRAAPAAGGEAGLDVAAAPVSLRHVAAVGSILPYWGTFLFLSARSLRARTILELGACAGISGSYLAAAPTCTWFVSVEGSAPLSRLAGAQLARINPRSRVMNLPFDEALDQILPALPAPIDLAFVDGEHSERALRRYFERLAPHVRAGGALLLDDIHWSGQMESGWAAVARSQPVAYSIDLGRLGLCVLGGREGEPRVFDFAPFTAYWSRPS